MRKTILIALSCMLIVSGRVCVAQTRLKYTFLAQPDRSILHVRLEFRGNKEGLTRLVLPSSWAGENALYKSITNLRICDNVTTLTDTDVSHIKTIRYPPNHRVCVTYDLLADWTGPLRHPKEFRALVAPDYFLFNGKNGMVYPEIADNADSEVEIAWKKIFPSWTEVSSFGVGRRVRYHGRWSGVKNALLAAGDFRLTTTKDSAETVTIALRGNWSFEDKRAADEFVRILKAERRFWHEGDRSSFVFVVSPFDQDLGSSDGTAFTNSFLLFLSRRQTFTTDIESQVAHEIFHGWNPYRMNLDVSDETQWFTEGFTRYYQDRILLDAHMISFDEYLKQLNSILATYWSSPQRSWSQAEWIAARKNGTAESRLPYSRGAAIALWLDESLRTNSRGSWSLDDRMRALLQLGKQGTITKQTLMETLVEGLSVPQRDQFYSIVNDGAEISFPAQLLAHCAVLEDMSPPRYKAVNSKCITEVAASEPHE